MKLRPAQTCLGCCSLLLGVEVSVAFGLFVQVLAIAICSSAQPLRVIGLVIPPEVQIFAAAWSFVGIPIGIAGGVGALHRIEANVRVLFFHTAGSFLLGLSVPVWLLASGSVCDLVVARELQSQGTAFICGFADTFAFSWSLMGLLTHAYVVFIIWSTAEDIKRFPNPELMRYEAALRDANLAPTDETNGPTPEMYAKAAFVPQAPPSGGPVAVARAPVTMVGDAMPRSYGGCAVPAGGRAPPPHMGPGPVSMALDAAAAQAGLPGGGNAGRPFEDAGVPQSFFPAPSPGARFNSAAYA